MAYHIYTTKGIVLSWRPLREADRIYSILTEELGLIRARAGGVRLEKSKLRGALEPYAIATVSLVRGKEHWRITSAQIEERLPAVRELARPFDLLERLVAGEERHPELYRAVEAFINAAPALNADFETRLAATIMYHLGYLQESDLALGRAELVAAINQGLKNSHLA